MPFADERFDVAVLDYRATWPDDFATIADQLRAIVGRLAAAIDHVGSTSVPGLAAKDCIDLQLRVAALDELVEPPTAAGFRLRPEIWNRVEVSAGVECRKLVFAPAVGARTCNVHVRLLGGANARYALLFRDYLRANDAARTGWGAFKQRLAARVPDLAGYGQIKEPATGVLMAGAEGWAEQTGWDTL